MTYCPLTPPLYTARVTDWIRLHALRSLGLEPVTRDELDAAVASNRDPHFDELRDARLAMGHLRYGGLGRSPYDVIGSMIARLDEYRTTGNREYLVDVANLAEIEWARGSCCAIGTHWDAQDCGGHASLR